MNVWSLGLVEERKRKIVAKELKEMAKKSKTAIIAYKLYDTWKVKRRFKQGDPETPDGSTHLKFNLDESLAYVNTQYDDYMKYGELSPASLRGKRVFELGFGDNVGVALKFLAVCEMRQAVCLDKFYATRDQNHQRRIYEALRDTLNEEERKRFDEAIDLASPDLEMNPEKLKCIYGVDVENASELADAEPFDLIISRAAVQDIYEPDIAFAAMDRLLVPGGLMMHKIDLSDQGMFRDNGLHPMTFLTVSEGVYRRMAVDSGRPNRKLMGYYRDKMKELGYETKILITEVFGRRGMGDLDHVEQLEAGAPHTESARALVAEIRPRLAPPFKNLPDEELMVSGIFLIAKKPV